MLRRSAFVTIALCAGLSTGCEAIVDALIGEPDADVEHPKSFSHSGLSFSYPGNWEVEAEQETIEDIGVTTLTVESSGSALLMIVQYQPSGEFGEDYAEEFLDDVVKEMAATADGAFTVKSLGVQDATRTLFGREVRGRQKALSTSMLGEKVPHTQRAFVVDLEDRSVVTYSQIADEDAKKARPGFELVLDSLAIKD
ncbi:MAG: hypothetical protein AAF799_07060 [Myxococcota bacterium]